MSSPVNNYSPLVEEHLATRKMRYHVISMCCRNYATQFELRNLSYSSIIPNHAIRLSDFPFRSFLDSPQSGR